MDDIADSFDYKNKYAIVEYLSDILLQGEFKQIILTHNYDFYRTVWHRLSLGGANYHIVRSSDEVKLTAEEMHRDPFKKWRDQALMEGDESAFIAMIPFVRNLAEFCGLDSEYASLTTLLHIRPSHQPLTIGQLSAIYSKVLNQEVSLAVRDNEEVVPFILRVAGGLLSLDSDQRELKRKVILSIAIRLMAEQVMIGVIQDDDWVVAIKSNQTAKLIRRFRDVVREREEYSNAVSVMDRVGLMTPENIHLNSFMYEPILDMSSEHLSNLFQEVEGLVSVEEFRR